MAGFSLLSGLYILIGLGGHVKQLGFEMRAMMQARWVVMFSGICDFLLKLLYKSVFFSLGQNKSHFDQNC